MQDPGLSLVHNACQSNAQQSIKLSNFVLKVRVIDPYP